MSSPADRQQMVLNYCPACGQELTSKGGMWDEYVRCPEHGWMWAEYTLDT